MNIIDASKWGGGINGWLYSSVKEKTHEQIMNELYIEQNKLYM